MTNEIFEPCLECRVKKEYPSLFPGHMCDEVLAVYLARGDKDDVIIELVGMLRNAIERINHGQY